MRTRGWAVRLALSLGLLWVALAARGAAPVAVTACVDDAYDLIGMVNSVRTAAGLAPFEINGTLMAVAQAHSEYQASIGEGTHIGPGGSRPADRVRAAGYGAGHAIYVSENFAWGYNLTPQGAMDMWLPSPPHYQTMTGALYHDVGAGCARAGDRVYYTLVAAGIAGQAPPPPPSTPGPGSGPSPTPPRPTPTLPYEPVIPATPRPDGAVIHTVQRGQTLMMIAGSYRVPLEDLLRYNDLTETSLLRIGQQLIIVPPQVTATPTSTPTRPPAATGTAAPTLTTRAAVAPAATRAPTPSSPAATRAPAAARAGAAMPARALVVALALGLALALGGGWLARRAATA